MAEFLWYFAVLFNVRIAYRGGGLDGRWCGVGWGGVGGGKKYWLGHPWSNHDTIRCPHNGPYHIGRQWQSY